MIKRWIMYSASEAIPWRHIVPENDEKEHSTSGPECWCIPAVEYVHEETGDIYEFPLVIHNSADGRELVEQAEEIKNGTWIPPDDEWPDVMGSG